MGFDGERVTGIVFGALFDDVGAGTDKDGSVFGVLGEGKRERLGEEFTAFSRKEPVVGDREEDVLLVVGGREAEGIEAGVWQSRDGGTCGKGMKTRT